MADRSRSFTVAAIALPFLFLTMSGLARAIPVNYIDVDTLSGGSVVGACSLADAVTAANTGSAVNGCQAGTGNDEIDFFVTGTIFVDIGKLPLTITDATLSIVGPTFGCSGAGPCGITIDGGGYNEIIDAENSGSGKSLTLKNLTFQNGYATASSPNGANGGAIYANGTDLEIDDCLFVDNIADAGPHGGGAIFVNAGAVNIVNSSFADNKAQGTGSHGGAIADPADSALTITNCTFDGNSADGSGGALGITSATPKVKGTIFANSTGGNCASGTPTDKGYNISDDASCSFSATHSLNNTNPRLEPLANNGGPTQTFALEIFPLFSPAIARIPVANCTDQESPTPKPLLTDQRLYGRPDPTNPFYCDSGAYESFAVAPIVLVPKTERVQIVHSGSPMSDQVNMAFTFIDNGVPTCDAGDDALDGMYVALLQGTCAELPDIGLLAILDPFTVHTINGQSYGTFFNTDPLGSVSAKIIKLPTPWGSCGKWSLNVEVSGIATADFGLTGGNPFALILSNQDGEEGCFDITNAIVGAQIDPPARGVRRGVRR